MRIPSEPQKQGIVQGRLDQVIDLFIIKDDIHEHIGKRVMSYGEFENNYPRIKKSEKLDVVIKLFSDFHPADKPVLWRILLSQTMLYNSIIILNNTTQDEFNLSGSIKMFSTEERHKYFDWRNEKQKNSISRGEIDKPFSAIKDYFEKERGIKPN
jgi:hypothetical protein